VSLTRGNAFIGEDTFLKGEIRNGGLIEVRGYVEGAIAAEQVRIQHGGRVFGSLRADVVMVEGTLQGTARVRQLMSIASTGSVHGDVKYGQLAMAAGGDLSADVRNVPPELTGDFHVVVRRGRFAQLTTHDISAIDPDDGPDQLTYSVTKPVNGFIARLAAPSTAAERFTQAELQAGNIIFVHDGTAGDGASFDVYVADHTGATSGDPQTIVVAVVAGP
jgi:cytoskeletal protein CcmA (bactofilin family)